MPPSVANQPGKSPETAPQTPKLQLSPEEQARLNLEAQQKIEIARAAHEQAEAKAKAVEASGAKRADVIAAPLATPSTPATTPAATPTPAPDKPFRDKIKDFFGDAFGKFKDFFDSLSTKFSSFFDKLFKKKEALAATPSPSNTPAPAPGSSPASPSVPETAKATSSLEKGKNSWKPVIESEAKRLGIEPAFAYAIIQVEAGKNGLNASGKPIIRFEAHVFNNQLAKHGHREKHGSWGASTLVGRKVDGVSCEGGQGAENACLQKALEIDKEAAYSSVSMGLGQIMGFNSNLVGYSNAENMYNSFSSGGGGEEEQLKAMFKLIERSPHILQAARNKDFGAFTRGYNGATAGTPHYNQYVANLQAAYRSNIG